MLGAERRGLVAMVREVDPGCEAREDDDAAEGTANYNESALLAECIDCKHTSGRKECASEHPQAQTRVSMNRLLLSLLE